MMILAVFPSKRGTAVADLMAVMLEEEGVVIPAVRRTSPVDA